MNKPTIIGLYGLPGSGKTFTKDQLRNLDGDDEFLFFDGSALIDAMVPGGLIAFKALTALEKERYRKAAIAQIQQECIESGKSGLVTGHCMFWSEAVEIGEWVVTDKDLDVYSHIIYLDVSAEIILQRCQNDDRLRASASLNHLRKWQAEEKNRLRKECYKHGILLSILTTSQRPNSQALLVDHILAMIQDFARYSIKDNQLHAEHIFDNMVELDKLDNMLVLDGDRTLTVEDTTDVFWKAVAAIGDTNGHDDPHSTLFEGALKYTHTAFRQAMLLFEDAAFWISRDVFDTICDQVAEAVTFRQEFKSLLKRVTESPNIGAVVVTCGHRLIWQKVLGKAGVSNKVQVIGGGTLSAGYIVTPSVKGAIVESLRKRSSCRIWAFGDSPVDLFMLREADEAVVVVGEMNARSKSMEAKLPQMLAGRQVKAYQLLLPGHVAPRLDIEQLPLISILEIEQQIGFPLMPGLLHATGKGAAQILMAQTRNARNCGPLLQEAHRQVGRYLALEYLPTAIGLETYSIPHVQAGTSVDASRILNEDKTMIVALMRGGLPMAEGVNDVLQLASILHAKIPADLKQAHLDTQSAVVLVDAVINNGDTIKDFVHHIRALAPKMPIFVVADVVQSQSVSKGGAIWDLVLLYGDLKVVALRLSSNKYTGVGTTDTGNRLFNTTFLQK